VCVCVQRAVMHAYIATFLARKTLAGILTKLQRYKLNHKPRTAQMINVRGCDQFK